MTRRLFILSLSVLACATTASGQPSTRALVGGTLVDPRAASIPNASVVVRNGRIVCAGTRANCPAPSGARIVNVSGKFITAGLIDAHVHYSQTAWVDGRPDAVDLRAQFPYDSTVAANSSRRPVIATSFVI